nr:putative reverse transcriptase domain-containing protein [Tanacetum cinerariifolium]
MLLYSSDGGLDVCVDLTGSSPLTPTGMADFVPGRAVIDAAQRKQEKLCFSDRGVVGKVLGQLQVPYLGDHFGSYLVCDVIDPLQQQRQQQQQHQKKVGCHDGGGNGLTKTYLITHLRDRHCNGDAQATTKHAILTDLVVFERAEVTLKRIGIWLCDVCFKTHTLRAKCHHGADFVSPPDIGDGFVHFVLYDLTKPLVPFCSQLDLVDGLLHDQHDGFTLSLLDNLFSKGYSCLSVSLKPFARGLIWSAGHLTNVNARKKVSPMPSDLGCRRKICDGHYIVVVRVLSSLGVAAYNDATLQELKAKHPFKSASSLLDTHIDHHHLIASETVVLDRIKSFPRSKSCGRDGLRAKHLVDYLSGAVVAVSDELFGVGVPRGGEAILYAVNHLVEDRGDDLSLSMLLVDFQNAFNLIDRTIMLDEVRLRCPAISRWVEFCYSSPARLYYGEHSLWSCQGVQQGDPLCPFLFSLVLHPLICKIRDSFNLCLQEWYLDEGTIVGDTLVVGKVLELIKEMVRVVACTLTLTRLSSSGPKKTIGA